MNTVIIRLAGKKDIEALCRLYFEFHEFHARGVPDRLLSLGDPVSFDNGWLSTNLKKIINQADSAIFIAEIDDQAVGLAEVYIRQDETNSNKVSHKYGYLQSLMVTELFRQQGIGTQLVKAAQQWARQKGATEIRLETWEFAEGPLKFYQKNGYRTLRRTLIREL